MNARTYDPPLGRMLSPDPFVQFPRHWQSYNTARENRTRARYRCKYGALRTVVSWLRFSGRLTTATVVAVAAGCGAEPLLPTHITVVLGTDKIVVLTEDQFSYRGCTDLGKLYASDGLEGDRHTIRYVGTKERALALLKIRAVDAQADTIVVTGIRESLQSSPDTGYQIEVDAVAYSCHGGPFERRSSAP